MPELHRLCVYAGSNPGARPEYAAAAQALASRMAEQGIGLVYGGGRVGLMGVLADTMLAASGEAIGIIPRALADREVAHAGLTDLRIVGSMHERKAQMAELADGFIAIPGGVGTLEELIEIITWAQLGIHAKPCGLLDVAGFYTGLRDQLDHMTREGFVRQERRDALLWDSDPGALLERLRSFRTPTGA